MRGWLYSTDKPEGGIFEGEAYASKVNAGWVDSPALLDKNETVSEPAKVKGKPGPKPKGSQS